MNWALIAGGSKGIGLSIARALAIRNYNLLLVARDHHVLIKVKDQLEDEFHIQVEILPCDLSLSTSSKQIFDWCADKKIDINILCNAVGMGGEKDFPDLSLDNLRSMIQSNFESAITLCSLFIPVLKKAGPSYILNIASIAGFSPIPIKSVYASTKSALISFSYSLKYILKPDNIFASCLCPGPVFTKPSIEKETVRQMGWIGRQMAVSPERIGEYAVQQMLKHKTIIVPGKLVTVLSWLLRILPKSLVARIIYRKKKTNS